MLKFKYKILFTFLIFNSTFIVAQSSDIKRTYNWYFGVNAGLNFSSGSPAVVTNGQLASSGSCSSISDTLGNLLFYTLYPLKFKDVFTYQRSLPP